MKRLGASWLVLGGLALVVLLPSVAMSSKAQGTGTDATISALQTELAVLQTEVAVQRTEVAIQRTEVAALRTQIAAGGSVTASTSFPTPDVSRLSSLVASPQASPPASPVSDVLYHTGGASGFEGWSLSSGATRRDGLLFRGGGSDTAWPPYQPAVADYAVEAEMRLVAAGERGCESGFGFQVRYSLPATYIVAVRDAGCADGRGYAEIQWRQSGEEGTLARTDFDPGSDWHAYRVEVRGERIRLLVDGAVLLEATDDRIRLAGYAGLFAGDLQLHVRSFTVTAL